MTVHRERLWPSTTIWLLAIGLAVLSGLAAVPFGPVHAVIVGAIVLIGVGAALTATAAPVEVDATSLRAGRARIEREHLGEIEIFEGDAARTAMGRDLDARAHLMTRPWIRTLVRVQNTDAHDPAPYWLLSSRQPRRLAAALRSSVAAD